MSKWVVLLIASFAQSLNVVRWHAFDNANQSADGLCDREALYKAYQARDDWRTLKGSPCMNEQIFKQLESGERDPADNVEFLGDVGVQDLIIPSPVVISKLGEGLRTMFPKVQFLGIPHSGSTSFAAQLNHHPQLSYGLQKEHNMVFNIGKTSNAVLKKAYESNFVLRTGLQFGDPALVKYTFDASPDTIFIGCPDDPRMVELPIGKTHGTGVKGVRAVKKFLGSDTKYIIMLRDPLDWQLSDAAFNGTAVVPPLTLEHVLRKSMDAKRSCYVDCIESWTEVVGKSNILFLESGEYLKNPQETFNQVFNFLGLSPKTYTENELNTQQGRRRLVSKGFSDSDRKLYWQDSHVKECKSRLQTLSQRHWPWGP